MSVHFSFVVKMGLKGPIRITRETFTPKLIPERVSLAAQAEMWWAFGSRFWRRFSSGR